jgi:hypothetical protein
LEADPLVSERQDGLFLNPHEAFPGMFEPSSEFMELDREMHNPPQSTYLDDTAQIEQGLISTISVKQTIIPRKVDQDTAYLTVPVEDENSSLVSPRYGDTTPLDEEPDCHQNSGLVPDSCFGMVCCLKCALMWRYFGILCDFIDVTMGIPSDTSQISHQPYVRSSPHGTCADLWDSC